MSRRGSEWARRCPQSARLEREIDGALDDAHEWGGRRLHDLRDCVSRLEREHRAMGRRFVRDEPWHYSRTRPEVVRLFTVRACVEALTERDLEALLDRLSGLREDFLRGYQLQATTKRALCALGLSARDVAAWSARLPYQLSGETSEDLTTLESLARELLTQIDEHRYRRATGAA